jgi:signal transduction histidine kinase
VPPGPLPIDPQERQAVRLQVLAESSHAFAEATTDVERLLRLVAERAAHLVGDGCYIRLIGADGLHLEPVATYHPDPEVERFLRETADGVPLRVGEGISGRVVETGEPALIAQVSMEDYRRQTKPEFAAIFERVGVSSILVVRLRARATNLGFIALVRNGTGRPAYTQDDLHLMRDLADRAALAMDNARMVRDLERRVRERTEELEAFSYSVSHDLRAPLRAIDGFSRILEEDHSAALDEGGRRVVAVIRRNTQRMGQLIDDLLRFSRLARQELRTSMVQMRPMIEAVVEDLHAAEPSRSIQVRIGDLPPASCDHDLVRQVWTNLLSNAAKYTRARPVAVIEIDGDVADDEVRYTVRDNGTGFDSKYASKLFQVFQRLHSAAEFEGTGVGLALVQRIVARHGGRVWAEGRPDQGATFGFALPRGRTT